MSIDFSKVTNLEIPEGVVTEIKDSLGRVIWSAKPKICEVTIGYSFWGVSSVTIDGTTYSKVPTGGSLTDTVTLTLPVGTIVTCQVKGNASNTGYVKVNGNIVAQTTAGTVESITYDYVVESNVRIGQSTNGSGMTGGGTIIITEQ